MMDPSEKILTPDSRLVDAALSIQYIECQGKSERQERMMDLTVEIEGVIGTLEKALRHYTGIEILDGENKYNLW